MRASDTVKETRSYKVFKDHDQGLIVKSSHWAPGYTPGHCSTPEEAVRHAIEQAERRMAEAQAEVVELYDYLATMMDEDR